MNNYENYENYENFQRKKRPNIEVLNLKKVNVAQNYTWVLLRTSNSEYRKHFITNIGKILRTSNNEHETIYIGKIKLLIFWEHLRIDIKGI